VTEKTRQANVVIPKGKDGKGKQYIHRLQDYAKKLRKEAGTLLPRDR